MNKRFIISGGGTGGHIFPALAIANQIKKEVPDADILFIGAENKMEMKRVPDAGYPIEGLKIYGVSRDFSLKGIMSNLKLPFVLFKAYNKAKRIIRFFNPDVVIGVGGFASGPALRAATALKIPAVIQEQNSYPGMTNRWVAKKVQKIFVAYEGLEKYFPKEKIVLTGNPVRAEISQVVKKREEAFEYFGLDPNKKTILVMGGSLGARSINQTIASNMDTFNNPQLQLIWQTGELFYKTLPPHWIQIQNENIKIVPFIQRMDHAYSVADLIVSRAGALAIAELTLIGTPTILIPFPYAAEDHQTMNASALSTHGAAILIPDSEVHSQLIPNLTALLEDEERAIQMGEKMKQFSFPNAIEDIVNAILNLKK
jgi:UDP-N-acetylglucosamine--N-acetylmuramyl-(pentapeptide) pyrophosphoryl-undecaprenol N-acetylglucosamine transferase